MVCGSVQIQKLKAIVITFVAFMGGIAVVTFGMLAGLVEVLIPMVVIC
jgi:hypothetical protein